MRCLECGSEAVTERPERTAQGYRRFRCRACAKQFNERSGGALNRTQYPSDVIALVVLWRLRYKLALRDLPEMFAIRGIVFSYEAVREWEAKLTPALAEELRRRRRGKVVRSWYVDETYLKVHGRWCYLYRAIDRNGNLVDVLFSEHRDMAAAQAFFRSAKAVTGVTPDRVTTDGHDSYPPGDPDRARPGCAAPDQCLLEQQAGAGPPGHQRSLPAHAGLQMPQIGRPVLPCLR
jgi:putative transposase